MRPFVKFERWRVVGFCPHATSAGVFGINLIALVPILGSFEGGAQHNEQGNRTIMLYHFHLAVGARMWGYYIAPGGTALPRTRGAYVPD